MAVRFLASDGGPHPPHLWAQTSARQILVLGPGAPPEAFRMRQAILHELEKSHTEVQESERATLSVGTNSKRPDPTPYLDKAVAAVVTVTQGTQFEDHFNQPLVQDHVRRILGQHFATVMQIERDWHAKRQARKTP